MSMNLYTVDLTDISEKERASILEYLDKYAYDGLHQKPHTFIYECCIDRKYISTVLQNVPESLLRPGPSKS